jgi:diguanylate cyclase (GGDEF)-like protein
MEAGMRRLPFLATLVGVVLLATGLMVTAQAITQGREQQATLRHDAAQAAASFTSYFDRARSLDLLLAQSQTLILAGPGAIDRGAVNQALQYLQVLYPDAIGEACVIDEHGREVARVTQGRPAAAADLSSNEAQNPFFAPTLALGPGQVYQAAPYVSPDTHTWVISNSTWIRLPDGRRVIVHFEVALASFAKYVATSVAGRHVAVIDRATGQIALRDHTALPAAMPAGPFAMANWSARPANSATGTARVNGHRVVLNRIDRTAGNANDWYVAEWTTARASLLPTWSGLTGTALGLLLIVIALVALRRQQSTLRAAAHLDHLTGMGNRKALEEALDAAVAAASRPGGDRVAVLTLDLDGFKQINDTLGHDKGDLVLQEVAHRLHANVFEYDTAARLGGDEFAVVLRRLRKADDVAAVAHRLREALIRPIDIGGMPRFIGASVGAAVYPDHGRSPAELLRGADAAMYQAKRERGGVRVYDPGTVAGVAALGLAAELMTAIDTEQLELAFQPQFSISTGKIIGVEALARWNRPGHGSVPPSEFIPLAEQTGLIHSLTYLTLRLALDEVQIWRDQGSDVPVSVNLSGQMAADRRLPEQVSAMLAERGLDPNALVLEITETAAIRDRDGALEVLRRLRAIGVRVELDDFGSGYASFAALHDLPLDGVKLDRSLITNQAPGDTRLLAGTIEFARRLGLKVIVEGIEDAATLDLVRQLGCDTAQGYHLARPTTPDTIRALLAEPKPFPRA